MLSGEEKENKAEKDYEDRRIFARVKAAVLLRYFHKKEETGGVTLDISAQGLGLVSHEAIHANEPVQIFLRFPRAQEEFLTMGTVVWCRKTADNKYRLGINLENPEFMIISQLMNGLSRNG